MSAGQEQSLETDACAELPGATGGRESDSNNHSSTKIEYKDKYGSQFTVQTSGNTPFMQVGHHNTMHISQSGSSRSSSKPNKDAKLPLPKSTDIPNGKAMEIVAKHIGRDWKALGRQLGFSDGELDNIRIDFHTEGQFEVSYQMIRKWKEDTYPTQLRTLAKACKNIGRGDVSDRLAEKFAS